jgi:hypothetical protein
MWWIAIWIGVSIPLALLVVAYLRAAHDHADELFNGSDHDPLR